VIPVATGSVLPPERRADAHMGRALSTVTRDRFGGRRNLRRL